MEFYEIIKKAIELNESISDATCWIEGPSEKSLCMHACDVAVHVNDDWDSKGFVRTSIVQTGDNDFYSIKSEHDSNGECYGLCETIKKVKKKTKTVSYYE